MCHQFGNAAGAVEQAVVAVAMQMDKVHGGDTVEDEIPFPSDYVAMSNMVTGRRSEATARRQPASSGRARVEPLELSANRAAAL